MQALMAIIWGALQFQLNFSIFYTWPFFSCLINLTVSLSRRSFGSVLDVVPLADSVTKLTARCELCGKRAFFTLRKTEDKQTELIAGSDVYMPVCRQHYVNGQVIIEAARSVIDSHKVKTMKNETFSEVASVV